MGYRQRVYRTKKLKNGDRVVESWDGDDYFLWQLIKGFFKLIWLIFYWCFIHWIILLAKLIIKLIVLLFRKIFKKQ